jgi:ParB family chromosome partitioning protein
LFILHSAFALTMPKIGLGRGLDALIPAQAPETTSDHDTGGGSGVIELALDQIRANPHQPRMRLGVEDLNLDELAASIKEHGVIQPLIVIRTQGAGKPYTLIAGERRWQASQKAGLTHVPVIIKDYAPQQMLEVALIENIQRRDLSAMEEAVAYKQLIDEFGMTIEHVADRVGKNRTTVSNTVRLLKLPAQIQSAVMHNEISEGHARALLAQGMTVDYQLAALDEIKANDLSVRQTEALVKRYLAPAPKSMPAKAHENQRWAEIKTYESKLRDTLGTKVNLQRGRKGRGKIIIEFYSDEEFGAIYEKIVGAE